MPDAPVAIVTGAMGGIGRAVTADLVAHGYRVGAIGRREADEPVDGSLPLIADVRDAAGVERAVARTLEEYGRVDALVTTAAVLRSAPLHLTSDETWNEVLGVNLTGVFNAARAVLPAMIEAGRGSIVNLSSVHAVATFAGTAAYAASKGGIVSLSRQMAVEYADAGIRVNSLIVGAVDTAMSEAHRALLERDAISISPPSGALGRSARPEEIATAVRYLCSDEASFVTGSAVRIDGGLLSHLM